MYNLYRFDSATEFLEAIPVEDFFNNKMSRSYQVKDISVPEGMKVLKALKYFIDDKTILDAYQTAASRLIQEDIIEGKLCISVHPLDFLSSSENTHNWRSCHALDGDYAAGNLSYMIDNSTVICYLKSEHNDAIPNFPFAWNNKKWRVLLYFSDLWDMVFAGRQYPFNSDMMIDFVKKIMFPKCGLGEYWTGWRGGLLTSYKEPRSGRTYDFGALVPIEDEFVSLRKLVGNLRGSMNYNDLTDSTCYTPIYAYNTRNNFWGRTFSGSTSREYTKFHIGGYTPCGCCGKANITNSSILICNDCELEYGDLNNEDYGYCDSCGRHIVLEDAYYMGDYPFCEQCFNKYASTCDMCGAYCFNEELRYHRASQKMVCPSCISYYNLLEEDLVDNGECEE